MTAHRGDDPALLLAFKISGSTYHGPIKVHHNGSNVDLVTLTGSSEPGLLRTAAAWLADHPKAVLISINWHDALLSPSGDLQALPPQHRLDLTIRLPI